MRLAKALVLVSIISFVTACGDAGDAREDGGSGTLNMTFDNLGSVVDLTGESSFTIELSFENASDDATYDLFFDEFSSCGTTEDNAIVDDNPVSTTSVNWSLPASGTYCVWGRVVDGTKTVTVTSSAITI